MLSSFFFGHRGALAYSYAAALCILLAINGCRTSPKLPAADLAASGWTLYEGQALWRPSHQAPEMAGDVILAVHPGREAFIQFTKSPLPVVTARSGPFGWEMQFEMEHRTLQGQGKPPSTPVWVNLVNYLINRQPPRGWQRETPTAQQWVWSFPRTGETLQLFLNQPLSLLD